MELFNKINKDCSKGELTNMIGSVKACYILNNSFNLDKFTKSLEKISKKIDIPIKIVDNESAIFLFNIEIYVIIKKDKLKIICSHKYYDGMSIGIIFFNMIDKEYNDITEKTFIDNSIIIKDKYTWSSLLNNIILLTNQLYQQDDISDELIMFKLINANNTKTMKILNNLQKLNMDFVLPVDTRKLMNVSEYTLGNYVAFYYSENKDINNFITNLKNIKNVSDIPSAPINTKLFNETILINSNLKFILPSFIDDQLPEYQYSFNGCSIYKYYIWITNPDKNGYAKIYINKNLYNLLKEKDLLDIFDNNV
jgi:hypothetical protein